MSMRVKELPSVLPRGYRRSSPVKIRPIIQDGAGFSPETVMKIRITSPDLRRIFYIPVEGDPIATEAEIRLHVCNALKNQYRRLDELTMELLVGDDVVAVATKGMAAVAEAVNSPISGQDVVG